MASRAKYYTIHQIINLDSQEFEVYSLARRIKLLIGRRTRPKKFYDVVVIGSGWGGMTAANNLAKLGHRVLLLEAHNKLGGLATWFRRSKGEHIFDVSLHGFPRGMIKTCRRHWGPTLAQQIVRIKKVRFINPQYSLESDFTRGDFTRLLTEYFKIPVSKVNAFFKELANMNFYDDQTITTHQLFNHHFPNRNDVERFLLEPICYANGTTLDDPAIAYGIVFSNFMNGGVYIFRGGTDKLITMLKDEMLNNKVDIKMHSLVEDIVICDGAVRGVVLQDGSTIEAHAVVSNANLKSTIFKMVGERKWHDNYLKRARNVRINTSSCQVFMGIKRGEVIPNIGELVFYSEDKKFSTGNLLSPKVKSQTFSFYYPEMRPHLDQRYAIVSSSNARQKDWPHPKSAAYIKRKQFLIERALETLEKLIPKIRDKIDFIDASTPFTIERYTRHEQGASFGTKFEGLDVSMNMHKEIAGLFHSGSVGIIMSGWLGAANYGVIQSHAVDTFLTSR